MHSTSSALHVADRYNVIVYKLSKSSVGALLGREYNLAAAEAEAAHSIFTAWGGACVSCDCSNSAHGIIYADSGAALPRSV